MNRRSFLGTVSTAIAALAYLPVVKAKSLELGPVDNRDWRCIGDPDPEAHYSLFHEHKSRICDNYGEPRCLILSNRVHLVRKGWAKPSESFSVQPIEQLFTTAALTDIFKIPKDVAKSLPPSHAGNGILWKVTIDELALHPTGYGKVLAFHKVQWTLNKWDLDFRSTPLFIE